MLKALRKKEVAKKILYVLAAIIIPAFVLWGSGSLIRGRSSENYAGEIFGKKISLDQFRNSLIAVKNQAIIKFGDNFFKIQQFLNLDKEAWDRLILLYEARKRKIKVLDSEVVNRIQGLPFLQTNGQFDAKLYQYLLSRILQTQARDFEEQIRQTIMFEKLYEQITKDIKANEDDALEAYKKENEQIKIGYIGFLTKDFEAGITIEEKELKDYFQEHSANFRKPASMNIEYIGMDFPEDPTEENKQAAREKITEIYSLLKQEKDLKKISEKYSLPIKETGLFNLGDPIPGFGLEFEIIQAAANLSSEAISNPIEIPKGIYLLKLKEKKASYIPFFEEAKPSVEQIFKNQKAQKLTEDKAKEYLSKLEEVYRADPGDFNLENTAKNDSLNYAQTPLFKFGEYVPDIGASQEFSKKAFNLKDGNKILDLVSTTKGAYILRLEQFVPIDENKFAKEKDAFKEGLLFKRKDDAFNQFFLELKAKARLVDNISRLRSQRQ
jgi:peptidyl-prolyl cis-trans isomerase D